MFGDFDAGVGDPSWDKVKGEARGPAVLIVRLGLGDGVLGRSPASSFARIGEELTRGRIVSSVSEGNLTGDRISGVTAVSSGVVRDLTGVRGGSIDRFGIEVESRLLTLLGTGVAFGDLWPFLLAVELAVEDWDVFINSLRRETRFDAAEGVELPFNPFWIAPRVDTLDGARDPYDSDAFDPVLDNESENCFSDSSSVSWCALSSTVERATRVDVVDGANERVL